MSADTDDTTRDPAALDEALARALAGLGDDGADANVDTVDSRWLAVGLRLGLEHPDRARALLAAIEAAEQAGELDTDPGPTTSVPVSSSLLVRAAAIPAQERAAAGPEVLFGWVARLSPGEVLGLGRVAGEMLASGAPPDLGRAFGITWDAGVRLPRRELDAMFAEFTDLQVTAASVLSGRDLRAIEPLPRPRGLAALLDWWPARSRPEAPAVGAAIEAAGEPGRAGVVALWNVWMAVRHRSMIPAPTFGQLVRPWETIVGPLPPAGE